MKEKTQWYVGAPNGVVVCIDRDHPGFALEGRLWHSYSEEPVLFNDLGCMVLWMEDFFDKLNYPHREVNRRAFLPDDTYLLLKREERIKIMSDETLLGKHGDVGTFIVRVQHRQNNSMQGRITWMEQDRTVLFRSAWEMIRLIEEAVRTVAPDENADNEPTWFGERE